jgi:hypothetical protein
MADKIRCQCGAQFGAKDLNGNVRAVCPVCRCPLASQREDASLAATESRDRSTPSMHWNASATVVAVTQAELVPSPVDSRASGPLARIAQAASPEVRSTPTFSTRWQPPTGLTNHVGQRLDRSKSFPWGPPTEIGELISADCNVPESGPPSHATTLLIAAGIWVGVYVVFGELLPMVISSQANPTVMRCASAALGFVAGLVALAWLWPAAPFCTFVGTEGAAYLIGQWGQPAPRQVQVCLFRDMVALFTAQTHMYKNFIYEKTYFAFRLFRNVNDKPQLEIGGEHTCHNDFPEPGNLLHFGLKVEDVWSTHLVERLGSKLARDQTLAFPCRSADFREAMMGLGSPNTIREIRLNQREIQFVYPDRIEFMPLSAIETIQAKRGVLKFRQDDASWFGSKGRFRIDYQHLGNAQVFFFYLLQALFPEEGAT